MYTRCACDARPDATIDQSNATGQMPREMIDTAARRQSSSLLCPPAPTLYSRLSINGGWVINLTNGVARPICLNISSRAPPSHTSVVGRDFASGEDNSPPPPNYGASFSRVRQVAEKSVGRFALVKCKSYGTVVE